MEFYAHSGHLDDKSDWQRLPHHALAVAELAAKFAAPFGLERAARLAGLLHDLGKYTLAFQRRLEGGNDPIEHSTAGAAHVLGLARMGSVDFLLTQLVAYCILGHHAGLADRIGDSGFDDRLARFAADKRLVPHEAWRSELEIDATKLFPEGFRQADDKAAGGFQLAFMARMIFSCLVDADFKDTEAFYSGIRGPLRDRSWPSLQSMLPQFISAFDTHMGGMNKDGALNRLRADVLAHVRARARGPRGLFTLTVPTGGGKTLASLGFALDHAKAHGHSRIIYAIPFTSIIDQTARIFRSVLGDEHVLEHHSAIDDDKDFSDERWTGADKLKLAMEDWAAPVVVTTNVQFFESLFARKTSRARKLHNIANSVIILDEAQTIPRPLLKPCIRVLDELALNYGCSIVLCTATQPALDKDKLTGGLPLAGRELAPDPLGLSTKLRRADIVRAGPMTNDDLIAALRDTPQALVIVNSRKHALDLFRDAEAAGLDGLVHLTTRQYARHRQQILSDVRERLEAKAPVRVIATSLIEAGVDVDFPRVWRAEAGLDQIIQAAGRCNREGKRTRVESLVTVFSANDYPPPSEIAALVDDMARALTAEADLMSLAAIERYFGEVYWRVGEKLDAKKIIDMFGISARRGAEFQFREAAEAFRMIESGMAPVIVAKDDWANKAVHDMGIADISSGQIARRLQSYIVQVPPKARDLLLANRHVAFERPDLRADQFAVLKTGSLYRDDIGLLWDDAAYLMAENSII